MSVNIWEGKKAEELIDAIKNAGLSTGFKNALLAIARNVVYQNQNGATYYDDLYNALYPEPEPVDQTRIFHLNAPKTIQSTEDGVDTGFIAGYNTSFTCLFDGTLDAIPIADMASQRVMIYSAEEASNPNYIRGVNNVLWKRQSEVRIVNQFNNEGSYTTYNQDVSHRVKSIIRYNGSTHQFTGVSYVDNVKVLDGTSTVTLSETTSRTLKVGSGGSWGTMYGTINLCDIYNRVLTADEIQAILGVSI